MNQLIIDRRLFLFGLTGLGITALSGCMSGGNFGFLGYTTKPNYDQSIQSVYVPQFKTKVMQTNPYRGHELILTRYVVNEIESQTPWKILSDPDRADTELQGTVITFNKNLPNRTPFNEARELELVVGVEIVWFDLRPGNEGRVITNPRRRDIEIQESEGPFDPGRSPKGKGAEKPIPAVVFAQGRGLPELGETSTTAMQMALKNLARKIVHNMEETW